MVSKVDKNVICAIFRLICNVTTTILKYVSDVLVPEKELFFYSFSTKLILSTSKLLILYYCTKILNNFSVSIVHS